MSRVNPKPFHHKIAETRDAVVVQIPIGVVQSDAEVRMLRRICAATLLGSLMGIVLLFWNISRFGLSSFTMLLVILALMFAAGMIFLGMVAVANRVEEVVVDATGISIGVRRGDKVRGMKQYASEHIGMLQVVKTSQDMSPNGAVNPQRITFDYGSGVVGFGQNLNISAGEEIVSVVLSKFPHYGKRLSS